MPTLGISSQISTLISNNTYLFMNYFNVSNWIAKTAVYSGWKYC